MHAAEEAGRAAGGARHGSRSSPPPLAGSNAGDTTHEGGSGATLGPNGGPRHTDVASHATEPTGTEEGLATAAVAAGEAGAATIAASRVCLRMP